MTTSSGATALLLLAPLLALVLVALDRRRARSLAASLGPRAATLAAERSSGVRLVRRLLAALALLLGLAATLGLFGHDDVVGATRRADVVVCLDVSRSMLARDADPAASSRLSRARHEARRLAERARGDRLGLVVFAGEARLRVPLTEDLDTFVAALESAGGPEEPEAFSISRGGSDVGAALDAASSVLSAAGDGSGAAIVVLSDGEDFAGRGAAAAASCRARGIAVDAVAVGSALGAKIPLERRFPDGRAGASGAAFLRDARGQEVVTRMDAAALRAIAGAGGGVFADSAASSEVAASLYEREILPRAQTAAHGARRPAPRFQIPLALAVLLAAAELALADRRRARRSSALVSKTSSRATAVRLAGPAATLLLAGALLTPLSACGTTAEADRLAADAIEALRRGDVDAAESAASAAARAGGARLEPFRAFVRGNAAFARSEAAEAEAAKPGADATLLERSMAHAEDALAAWRTAVISSVSRDDGPEARRNVERALLRLERLRDRRALADRAKREAALAMPAAGDKATPGPKPDEGAPPPPPPTPEDAAPSAAQPVVGDMDPSRVLGLLDVLAQKEKAKAASRAVRRAARSAGGERDW